MGTVDLRDPRVHLRPKATWAGEEAKELIRGQW